jgi:hypothetical protein
MRPGSRDLLVRGKKSRKKKYESTSSHFIIRYNDGSSRQGEIFFIPVPSSQNGAFAI